MLMINFSEALWGHEATVAWRFNGSTEHHEMASLLVGMQRSMQKWIGISIEPHDMVCVINGLWMGKR